jgi:hypothetical protein
MPEEENEIEMSRQAHQVRQAQPGDLTATDCDMESEQT